MTRTRSGLFPLFTLVLLCGAPAQEKVEVDPGLRARFGFLGPHIRKLDWGLGSLSVGALEAGGPMRALVNNPRRARFEVLRLEGGSLEAASEGTGGEVQDVVLGDVDGDGRVDLLVLDGRGRLAVRLRGEGQARVPEIEVGKGAVREALKAGDLDGDGKADAVVLTEEGVRSVTGIAGAARVSAPDPVGEKVQGWELMDLDGDGRLDLVFATGAERMALRVKLGLGAGAFGPWLLFDIAKLQTIFRGSGYGGRPSLGSIEGAHGRVVEYELRREASGRGVRTQMCSLGERRGPSPFAWGDIDGDGGPDLVVADPGRARLAFFLEERGSFRVEEAPTLAGVSSLCIGDADGDGRPDLLLCSVEESALAWKSGARESAAFPEWLPSVDKPVAAVVQGGRVLLLARDERRQAAMYAINRKDGRFEAPVKLLDLGRLPGDPLRLISAELDGRPGEEIAMVVPGEGLRVLFADGEGGFRAPKEDQGKAGFTRKMEDGALALTETDRGPALVVARDRFARVFRYSQDQEPLILAQEASPDGSEGMELEAVLGDGSRLVLEKGARKLFRLAPGSPPVSADLPRMTATHLLPHPGGAVLVGLKEVVRLSFDGPGWELAAVRSHEPPTPETDYYQGMAADLDGDGCRDLVVLDAKIRGAHVLVAGEKSLRLALVFPVFEQPSDQRGGREPRAMAAGDMTGDGREDLVLLCHDRVLLYAQEGPAGESDKKED